MLSAGFEAMASQRLKLMEFSAVDMNSKIGFRSIHVVGQAAALSFAQHQPLDLHSIRLVKTTTNITFLFLVLFFFVDNYKMLIKTIRKRL